MSSTLGMIVSFIVIIAVYVIIAELYNTFQSAPYIGTAVLVTALYFANRDFVDAHRNWNWVIIMAVILLIAEVITGFLKMNRKTASALIIFSCALVGESLFRLLRLNEISMFCAIADTIVLICMTVYTFWAAGKRSIARIRDAGNPTTGIIAGLLMGAAAYITLDWLFRYVWSGFVSWHIAVRLIVQILFSVATCVIWIIFDKKRDEKRKERYAQLANELTLAREHYMNMIRDLDGVMASVPAKEKRLIMESMSLGADLKRYKQLRKIPAEKMSFYEYNDMLRVYPKLMDVFDPLDGKIDYEYDHYDDDMTSQNEAAGSAEASGAEAAGEGVGNSSEKTTGDGDAFEKESSENGRRGQEDISSRSRIVKSVYFNGCSNREELSTRYKQLAKVFHTDNAGGDKDSFIRLKKEYEAELARMK